MPSAAPSSVFAAAILVALPILSFMLLEASSTTMVAGRQVGGDGASSAGAGPAPRSDGQKHGAKPRAAFPPHGDRSDSPAASCYTRFRRARWVKFLCE